MPVPDTPTVTLTLRLLRKGITADKALKDDHDLARVGSTSGELYVCESPPTPPSWAGFLSYFSPDALAGLRTPRVRFWLK
jgi:hypothetical protein